MTLRVAPASVIIMRTSIVLAALLVAASTTAHAETPESKDPATATMASVGATLLPIAVGAAMVKNYDVEGSVLMGLGAMLGPSVGHWYTGEVGWTGLAIRGGAVGLMVLTGNDAAGCYIGDGGEEGKNCKLAQGAFVIGLGTFVGGVIYDWATAGDSARRANARTVSVAPMMISGPRSTGTGVGLAAKF